MRRFTMFSVDDFVDAPRFQAEIVNQIVKKRPNTEHDI